MKTTSSIFLCIVLSAALIPGESPGATNPQQMIISTKSITSKKGSASLKSTDTIKEELLQTLRDFLKNSRPSRMVGSKGHDGAAKYIEETIKKFDPQAQEHLSAHTFTPDVAWSQELYQQDFIREIKDKYPTQDPTYQKWNRFTRGMIHTLEEAKTLSGKNIVWEKKGKSKPQEILILGANYDTIAIDPQTLEVKPQVEMPGADDNGTGVSTLLELIHLLAKSDCERTVRIVFFDFEELGMLGSRAYGQKVALELGGKKNIESGQSKVFFVNVLMLGHDTVSEDKEKQEGNFKAYIRKMDEGGKKDEEWAKKIITWGDKAQAPIQFSIDPNGFNASSQINFWEQGIPALVLTQNWDSDYNMERQHTSNDFMETLNLKTFYAAYQFIAQATLSFARGE
ncbi:MAG: M28 family peptidase [Pseudomonadota bacterium]